MSVGNKTLVTCVCCFAAAGYLNRVNTKERNSDKPGVP